MSTEGQPSFESLGIENTEIETAPGVELDSHQKVIVGSVLDLFAGKPSLKKLGLWKDDGVFEDPIAKALGRKEYQAQWYGLPAAFSSITRLSHSITSSGNPIAMDLSTRYKVKGIGSETTINSQVLVHIDTGSGKIAKVEDRWNGNLPDGAIRNAFRRLNAVTVLLFVGVPQNDEEDKRKGL